MSVHHAGLVLRAVLTMGGATLTIRHYRMLNDHERNKAYGAALSMAISTRPALPVVLDIGELSPSVVL